MENKMYEQIPLGRIFSILTKKYLGFLSLQLKDSPVQRYFHPLYLIGKNSGNISQQQLASYLVSDKVSIVRVIDSLEKEKLIERKKNPEDRRQHLLCITKKAEPWIEKIAEAIQKTDKVFSSFLQKEMQPNFKPEMIKLMKQVIELPAEEIELFYSRKKTRK